MHYYNYCHVEDGPDLNLFRRSRLQDRQSREEATLDAVELEEYPSDEDVRESGAGILEFTPAKAGLDMTPANYDFESRDDKKRNATGLSNFAVGALSSVSNTLMHVVSKGYEGNRRSQETAPLLQDQNPSPEAHAKTTPVSSVPKSTSSITLPASSTSSYSQYEDQHGGGIGGHTNMVATVHPFSQSEAPQMLPSSPLQVERRLNELSRQLTRLEHKMSADIALILHVLQAQGSSHVTSPSTPPPPPPRMVEADTFPGSPGEYSNVYDYPPPPSHLPPPPSSEAASTIDSDLTWLPHDSTQETSLPPLLPSYPASNFHSTTHPSGPVSPLRTPAALPQSGSVPPLSSHPSASSHQLPATQSVGSATTTISQDGAESTDFSHSGEALPLRDSQTLYRDEYEPMIIDPGEESSLLQAEQGTYGSQSADSDDINDTLV
ncbi:potassium voltage-gated channel subfamily h member 7 [Plakobranchus ocellatus]|uniref:Potassium voltage-gated channel subfamily h member 7 n=1 Tax=Plakobranchus ocellatus TaxID=259542 RepID=A0AAV3Z9X8_9GAST|nr:potassium voltage-gated channel subfamily h member 7 [Plakobranchus ocellatus]